MLTSYGPNTNFALLCTIYGTANVFDAVKNDNVKYFEKPDKKTRKKRIKK